MEVHSENIIGTVRRSRLFFLTLMLIVPLGLGNIFNPTSVHAAIGTVTEYTTPTSSVSPEYLTVGSDGNIWYTGYQHIGKLTTGGSFTQYSPPQSYNFGITKGSDGNIWYSEQYSSGGNWYGRIVNTTTSGTVLGQYNIPSGRIALHLTLGPDGNVWFTESAYNRLGMITPSGTITEYSISTWGQPTYFNDITAGPDGNLWFTIGSTGTYNNGIGKITPLGTPTVYSLPAPAYNAYPQSITTGPDGNLWFTEQNSNKVAKVTTSGAFTTYSVPTSSSQPMGIAAGSDGALWFTEYQGGKIGQITTSGAVTEYAVSDASHMSQIVTGPDGAVWFTNGDMDRIGRLATQLNSRTISFSSTAPSSAVIDGPTYTPTAIATSGLSVKITLDSSSSSVCSIDGSGIVSFQGAGTCTIDANQVGNADYNPATQVQQSFTVAPVDAETSVVMTCPASAHIGDIVSCTITATNNGPAAAKNVNLTVLVPESLNSVSVSGGATLSGQTITWTTPSLASGDSETINVSGTASTASKTQFNASLLQTSPDPTSSNNIANSTLVIL